MKRFIFFISIICQPLLAWPQNNKDDLKQNLVQAERSRLMQVMDSGIHYMDIEEYVLADRKFMYVLQHIHGVPSDLTFYFGKNSYFLGKHRQCIDWLNKYIQLKGTSGQFYQEAIEWKGKSENALVKQKKEEAANAVNVLSVSYEIDCGPSGKVICTVCKGSHVIVRKGIFGNEYRTCPYCDDRGTLTCKEYNQLLRGELKPKK